MKKIRCIICNSADSKPHFKLDSNHNPKIKGLQIVKCSKCGLVFMNPQLEWSELATLYPDSLYQNKRKRKIVSALKRHYEDRELKKMLKLKPDAKNILDVGCGNGLFLEMCKKRGLDIYGTEISKDAVDHCRKMLKTKNIFLGGVESVPKMKFDIITLIGVIEHLTEPQDYIKRIFPLLAKDGMLVVRTMDIDCWSYRLVKEKWAYIGDQHLFYFSKKKFSQLLEKNGLRIKKVGIYNNSIPHLLFFIYSLPNYFFKKSKFPDYLDLYNYYIVKK